MKRPLIIFTIIAAVAGLSLAGYWYAAPTAEPPRLTDDPTVEIVPVGRKTLLNTVSASGKIEPKAEVAMNFEIGGIVAHVPVERGQYVPAGTVLARLNTQDLALEIKAAEIDVAQQRAEMDKLFEPVLAQKVAAAQAQVESARLKLADLQAGPDPDEVTKAEAELSRKQIALKQAQWEYDEVAYRGDIAAMPQANRLQEVTLDYEVALATYNLSVKNPTPAEIAEARYALAGAEAALAELLQEPSAADIAARQALVDKARLALAEKQRRLEQAVLTAPTAGVLLEVNLEPGERVLNDAQQAAILLADTSAYLLKMEVDEIDIARIARGQSAAVELDAFAGQQFSGVVADVSPRPVKSDSNAIVMYEVTITLQTNSTAPALLSGMTANAVVETGRLEEVVVVPNRAIQIDRSAAAPVIFVEKVNGDGSPTRVEVQLGLRQGEVTQVVSGLTEGDEVIIRSQPAATPQL
jgi:HlyD family secretion protein